MSDLKKRLINY